MKPMFIAIGAAILALCVGVAAARSDPKVAFAACLAQKGAVLYGAPWCGYCEYQKKMFGRGASRLRTVTCSESYYGDENPECAAKKIKALPTWIFADGSRLEGTQFLPALSQKTGCPWNGGYQ